MSAPREVFFLIGSEGQVLFHDTDESPLSLRDRRTRWEAIWTHRDVLVELSHSHPVGPDAFSHEDTTTMDALDAALGRRLGFSLVTPGGYFVRGPTNEALRTAPPPWTQRLRHASGMRSVVPWMAGPPARPRDELQLLAEALAKCDDVVFVCTHNSRRSQLAEAVARAIAGVAGLTRFRFFSAGTEATQVAPGALAALDRAGVDAQGLSSKTLGSPLLPRRDFVAVMVCSDADDACPVVSGATHRVRLPFADPRHAEGTADESATYDATLEAIARDLSAALTADTRP